MSKSLSRRRAQLPMPLIRAISTVSSVLIVTTMALSEPAQVSADTPPTPPFNQCPAIGLDTSCGLLIVINSDGTTAVYQDPSQGPYDGTEDTLIGVQNNSSETVSVIPISSSSSTPIFGFDGDGLCSGLYGGAPAPTGCPFGSSGYEGPNTSFTVNDSNNGTVNFTNGLAPGASVYFSLESAVTPGSVVVPRYVALGDSYSSGEGVPPFISPTDSSTNQCHRSMGAYPELIVNRTAVPPGVEFWACSGATIRSFYQSIYGEQPQKNDLLGSSPATLATVGVGGNDIGFRTVAQTCVSVMPPFQKEQNPDFHTPCGQYLDQPGQLQPNVLIDELTTGAFNAQDNVSYSLKTLYPDLRANAPLGRFYVIGYPNPLPLPNNVTSDCQADIVYENGSPVTGGPFNLVHAQYTIKQADVQWMEKIVARLNSAIQLNAVDAGFYFVDNSLTLSGHDICGNNVDHWIHGVVLLNGTTTISNFSFHPNATGQSHIADVVAGAIAGPPAGGFTSTVFPGQFVQNFIPVAGGQFQLVVETAWPGSDVQLSLVSPSGVVYDRTTQATGVVHTLESNGESLAISNPQAGQWTVKLYGSNVASSGEKVRVDVNQIANSAFAPVAAIKSSTDRGVAPTTVQFDGTGSTAYNGATITNYTWDFGDGTGQVNGSTPTHVYSSAGSYTVTLTVTDSNGQTDSASNTEAVTATDQPPTASFIWGALNTSNPTNMSFDASASNDVDGQITSYSWNFGDGTSSTGVLPTHSYATAGTYPVTLTVTDNGGLSASQCQGVQTDSGSGTQILPCTQTTLTSSTNPALAGQPVTFTATVSPVPPATGTPTGNVTFLDGSTSLGTVALGTGGTASLIVSNLTPGNHSISASYGGSTSFAGSTSGPLIEVIHSFPGMVAAGWFHNVAAKTDGTVWSWGRNNFGQLGNGTTTQSNVPVQVSNLNSVLGVAGGAYHSVAVKSDGTVWAWGYNGSGQLGNGTTTNSTTPVQVSNLSGVTAVAAGCNFTLALKSDGTVWDWGDNGYGQLGNGTTTSSSKPVQVTNLTGVTAIAGGCDHSIALKSDGTVWTWGDNHNGQLGNGSTTNSSKPVQVSNLANITSISAGEYHSLAARSDGTAWAWGYNQNGQLGDGTTKQKTTPVQVSNLTNVKTVAGGGGHSLALTASGAIWAWGLNSYGQLGNGTTTSSSTPVQVTNLTNGVMISGGVDHSIATTTAGLTWDWGNNQFGQLGNGTTANTSTPVQVNNLTGV